VDSGQRWLLTLRAAQRPSTSFNRNWLFLESRHSVATLSVWAKGEQIKNNI
jgi:hypothetical protein